MDSVPELKGRRAVEFMNNEDFIDAIKEQRLLWDPQDSGYSNKHQRDDAWIKVAATTFKDFYQRPVPEQDEINVAIQKKWRCLRTCYNREVLKKNEEKTYKMLQHKKRKQYLYFEKLRFLDTIPRRAPNVSAEENSEENSEFPNYIKCISKKRLTEKDEDSNHTVKRGRWSSGQLNESEHIYLKQEADDISVEFDASVSETNEDISSPLNIQSQPHTTTTYAHSADEDEDKMFLLSLLPDIKKIPQENKLRVKSDILLVLSNGQAPGSYNSPFYPLP